MDVSIGLAHCHPKHCGKATENRNTNFQLLSCIPFPHFSRKKKNYPGQSMKTPKLALGANSFSKDLQHNSQDQRESDVICTAHCCPMSCARILTNWQGGNQGTAVCFMGTERIKLQIILNETKIHLNWQMSIVVIMALHFIVHFVLCRLVFHTPGTAVGLPFYSGEDASGEGASFWLVVASRAPCT